MLKQNIGQQIIESLKGGDQLRLSTLRFLLSAIKNEEIAKQREVTDEDVVLVVQRQIKQRGESISAFEKGGRLDLASKERDEMAILSKFLPQQLQEEELRKIVEEIIIAFPESEKKNFGKAMGAVMARVKGRAGGDLVSKIVKESLES